jgi:hypothetical protein
LRPIKSSSPASHEESGVSDADPAKTTADELPEPTAVLAVSLLSRGLIAEIGMKGELRASA